MKPAYPHTRIESSTDVLSGVSFPDPYHWLENDSEEVRRWQRAQSDLASAHVRSWPHFERLRELVAHFSAERHTALPRYVAGRWFRMHIAPGASQAQALVAEGPMEEGRVLYDPMSDHPEQPPFLSWIAPSPDGRVLALGICTDGSENNTIRLVDVDTGRPLPGAPSQVLMDNWTGGVQWLPDSSGFFFSAITGAAVDFEQRVYLHRFAPVPQTELIDVKWNEARDYRMVLVGRDGRYAVALERLQNPIPIAVARLDENPLRWRPFVTGLDGTLAGQPIGDHFIAVTDIGAPRGRVVAMHLDSKDAHDPQTWQEVVAESDATLRTVTPVGDLLYLTELVDTYARVRIVDRRGQLRGEVPLPGRGALTELPFPMMNVIPKGHAEKFLFGFSSLTVSAGVYSHTPGDVKVETLQAPQVALGNAVVEDRWATSADGVRIPYHIVRLADVSDTRPEPTLIYAYGGYNVPRVPQFTGPLAAFVAAGGVYVHAHLRGGGEFGLQWWQSGRMRKKQNCYEDLYAVAEDLIAAGRCTPRALAVTGASNGGLMAGVAATQRPDLWTVAVPRAPILDLIGACRSSYGRQAVVEELAEVDDPDEVRRLATFSPYHLVRDGVRYPAVFIDAGETDPRCPPWHARKFAARLQKATASSAPILLHVWENVGHGWATDKNVAVTEHAEWLAFTLQQLGGGARLLRTSPEPTT